MNPETDEQRQLRGRRIRELAIELRALDIWQTANRVQVLEARVAYLELALNQIKNGCVDDDDVANELFRSAPSEIRALCLKALDGKEPL